MTVARETSPSASHRDVARPAAPQPERLLLVQLLDRLARFRWEVITGSLVVVAGTAVLDSVAMAVLNVTIRCLVLGGVVALIGELHVLVLERTREARYDALTGLLSRRAFFADAQLEMSRAERYGHAVVVLFVDVDGLKTINDAGGHDAGDAALREVGRRLGGATRRHDVVGRVGGDEFALVLPETDLEGARLIARRVVTDDSNAITVSVGIAACPPGRYDLDDALDRADAQMYHHKAHRRCHAATPTTALPVTPIPHEFGP